MFRSQSVPFANTPSKDPKDRKLAVDFFVSLCGVLPYYLSPFTNSLFCYYEIFTGTESFGSMVRGSGGSGGIPPVVFMFVVEISSIVEAYAHAESKSTIPPLSLNFGSSCLRILSRILTAFYLTQRGITRWLISQTKCFTPYFLQ